MKNKIQEKNKMGNFRWLHLSDFHIGKDNYGQIKLTCCATYS